MEVTYFQRRPREGFNFSIESIFEDVRQQLRDKIDAEIKISSHYNDGVKTKFLNIIEATKRQSSSINHITGEVHFLNIFMRKRTVVLTVHDCRIMERKNGLSKIIAKWLYLKLPIWKSQFVTANSEITKQDVIKYTNCNPDKITVIPVAIDDIYQPFPKTFNQDKPNILHIGTGENKNLLRLIEAIQGINCHLSIVGKLREEQKQCLVKYRIEYSNDYSISQNEMLQKYKECDILDFVSTFEGFGMPIIEANSVERVVLTSNISSMPEVAGDAALLVNPFNVEEIRKGIIELRDNQSLRKQLIENGRKNKMRFQSKNIAEQYYEIYQSMVT